MEHESSPPRLRPDLEDLHLQAAVGRGSVWHLQPLNEGVSELLHQGNDQALGHSLPGKKGSASPHHWKGDFHWIHCLLIV